MVAIAVFFCVLTFSLPLWGNIKLGAAFLEGPQLGLSVVETFPLFVLIIRCFILLYFF